MFLNLKENNFHPRLIYPAKLSSKIDREIKTFHYKEHLEFLTIKPALQKIFKDSLEAGNEEIKVTGSTGMNIASRMNS